MSVRQTLQSVLGALAPRRPAYAPVDEEDEIFAPTPSYTSPSYRTPGFNPNEPDPLGKLLPPMRQRGTAGSTPRPGVLGERAAGPATGRPPDIEPDTAPDFDSDSMMDRDPATNGDRRSSVLSILTPEDRRLREFDERVERDRLYERPKPSRLRSIFAALQGAGQGFLQGTGQELPDARFQSNITHTLYGDYPERVGSLNATRARLASSAKSAHDLMKQQIDLEEAISRGDYYKAENKRKASEFDRTLDQRKNEAEDRKRAKAMDLLRLLEQQDTMNARQGLEAQNPRTHETDEETGEERLRPGWAPYEVLRINPETMEPERRTLYKQVENPVPAYLQDQFPGRSTARPEEIREANRNAIAQQTEQSRMALEEHRAGTQRAIAGMRIAASQAMQTGRLSQEAMRSYVTAETNAQRELDRIYSFAQAQKTQIQQRQNYEQFKDPAKLKADLDSIDRVAAQQADQVKQTLERMSEMMSQGGGAAGMGAPRPIAPRQPAPQRDPMGIR